MINSEIEDHKGTPFLIITFSHAKDGHKAWNGKDIETSFAEIKEKMTLSPGAPKMKLMIVGNKNVAPPPVYKYPKLFKCIIQIKALAANCSTCTAIVRSQDSLEGFFTRLFKIFRPKNPLAFVDNLDDAFTFVMNPHDLPEGPTCRVIWPKK